jgi:hypothetical protein
MSSSNMQELRITFQNVTQAEGTVQAHALRRRLLELTDHEITCELIKDSNTTMDFGSTLVLLFGTPAAIAVAKGLYEALKRLSSSVVIKTANGRVLSFGDAASNINVDDVIEALNKGGPGGTSQ